MIAWTKIRPGDVLFRYARRSQWGRESFRIVVIEIDHAAGFAICSDNNNPARRYPRARVERWHRKPVSAPCGRR